MLWMVMTKLWKIMKCYEMLWNVMKCYEKLWKSYEQMMISYEKKCKCCGNVIKKKTPM